MHFHLLREEAVGIPWGIPPKLLRILSKKRGFLIVLGIVTCRFEMIEMVRVRIPFFLNIEM